MSGQRGWEIGDAGEGGDHGRGKGCGGGKDKGGRWAGRWMVGQFSVAGVSGRRGGGGGCGFEG